MRLTEYKNSINEAMKLPEEIKIMGVCAAFPRNRIIYDIIAKARIDEGLGHSELRELLNYAEQQKAPSH